MKLLEPDYSFAGKPAADFELKDLNGISVSLASLKGKVVVLDFWARWSGSSLSKMSGVALPLKERGVSYYSINLMELADNVRSYLSNHTLSIPVLLDTDGKVADLYKARTSPRIVLIDRTGIIQAVYVGYVENPRYQTRIHNILTNQLNTLIDGGSLTRPAP
jgi:peroxiredoxin